ncbi:MULTISPECIES: ABC transporter ATP-binding protein [Clostridium]|jgi:oligopeptide transport system ATP-binding protein|uniref:Oligopeptide transport ATP-binding protein OppD n=2 Tax=Clostridium TaxID=1485 RepID=M1MXT5_9CLOT|nr:MULTISPECIES: ABC transporter ATP-binding protein [Clostridium]AGF59341.1 oligopeptide transport ATP-binding protein OppD [Clostridium saccharoperbutylacetonicum N1-4(HMT)]AQR98012.1 oligopeptide transport ATP-binding protein OppD [Clostridium saccharoperbutylacetonicum]NRT59871.1 oligopeptide transport system ATP-binding protein [Clostridium saccharoperbutylacetonicum]NSB23183.1 oligopeptide transport system ATP-binding protein [Clostridium saccharoperbutylacetonicum]NSB33905.1 oligopeptid
MEKLLEVKNLETSFKTSAGEVHAVRGVSFDLEKGEALGIVGESGCGKSVTMMSIMRLLADNGRLAGGEIFFNGKDISNVKESEMETIRGNDIGMIFQDPMTSLNPVYTIGDQLMEPLLKHRKISKAEARKEAINMLGLVGIPSPEKRMKQYPHEFSGGMRQRAMIAMSLICAPKLIIADEPTTALDVTIQAQILDLMKDLKQKLDTAIILITHDLGVVADVCTKINVMYGGIIVETGTTEDIFYRGKHPYTWGLLRSVPNPKEDVKEKLIPIEGQPPDLLNPPVGCPFAARCDYAMKVCLQKQPPLFEVGEKHHTACWLCHEDAPKVESPIRRMK